MELNSRPHPLKWAKLFYELLTGEHIRNYIVSSRGGIGISQQQWYLMCEGKMKIPMNVAIQVSELCRGAVSISDIYREESEVKTLYQYMCAWIELYVVDDALNKVVNEVAISKNDRNNKVLKVLQEENSPIRPGDIARRINEDWCLFNGNPQGAVILPVLKRIGAVNVGNGWVIKGEGDGD